MKLYLSMLLLFVTLAAFAQTKAKVTTGKQGQTSLNRSSAVKSRMQAATVKPPVTPFVSGVHAAPNATTSLDTLQPQSTSQPTTTSSKPMIVSDTVYNANVINAYGGVPLTNNATKQFGETNWGDGRSTIGASQWTIPPPITYSFKRDYPQATETSWQRNEQDTSVFSARYKQSGSWVTSNYNATGMRLSTSTEIPLLQPPAAVASFIAQQPSGFKLRSIAKLEVQGKANVYQLETADGRKIYVNNSGSVVDY